MTKNAQIAFLVPADVKKLLRERAKKEHEGSIAALMRKLLREAAPEVKQLEEALENAA
jgi:hypothetical protein